MAADPFNSLGGYSVGIPSIQVVDSNGNIISNFNNLYGNVSANKIYANTFHYANGSPLIADPGGTNTQLQFNRAGVLGGIPNVTWDGNSLRLGNLSNLKITGGVNGQFLQTDGTGNLFWASGGGGGGNGTPGGTNTQVQFNDSGSFGGVVGFTFNKQTNTLFVENIASGNSIDDSINAAGGITANGTITAGNIISRGNIQANYIIGNGSLITGIVTSDANYVVQPDQPNITSVGTLTELMVSGNIFTSEYVSAGNIQTSGSLVAGNVRVVNTANVTGNLKVVGNASFSGSPNINLGPLSNIHISGGLNGYVLATDGMGNLSWQSGGGGGGNGSPAGSNTQIQFNNAGSFGASPYFIYNDFTRTVQVGGNLIANSFQVGAGIYKWSTSEVYFASTASTSLQVLYSVPVLEISGAEFHIIATDSDSSTRQSCKISSVVYQGQVQFTEYAGMYINGGVGTFQVDYNPGNIVTAPALELKVTPDSSNQTIYKILITLFAG